MPNFDTRVNVRSMSHHRLAENDSLQKRTQSKIQFILTLCVDKCNTNNKFSLLKSSAL